MISRYGKVNTKNAINQLRNQARRTPDKMTLAQAASPAGSPDTVIMGINIMAIVEVKFQHKYLNLN
jgi:hypothetical protein